jgi:hypothetical protein
MIFLDAQAVFAGGPKSAIAAVRMGTQGWNRHAKARVAMRAARRFAMRLLFGIILGAVLTVGGAYLYDSHQAAAAVSTPATAQRPLANWDVVAIKWSHLAARARAEWSRIASSS